jgi:AraC family transcriptional regulator
MKSQNQYSKSVLKALDYIESNLKYEITASDVCDQVPVSPWQFQRMFRFLVGDSIGSYIRGRRLSEAYSELLSSTDQRLIDLALEYQFNSHEAFTRAFKAYFGMTPKEARESAENYHLKRKPALDQGAMSVIWDAIRHDPEFSNIEACTLVGVMKEVASPFSNNEEFENNSHQAWREFYQQVGPACKRDWTSSPCFGIALNTKDQLISSSMSYLACKAASELKELPKGSSEFHLPANHYAVFAITASISQIQKFVDYIYGIWLPNSGYERSNGYDFEAFDFSQQTKSGMITYKYHLPIASLR